MTEVVCPECIEEGHGRYRPPASGATRHRCTTHWRAIKKARSLQAKEKRVENVYGITSEEYDAILEAQGGVCYICRIAKGTSKRLAVDHNHDHCEVCAGPQSCGDPDAIRGLLCSTDNQLLGIRGHGALLRAAQYLLTPPAPDVLKRLRGNA